MTAKNSGEGLMLVEFFGVPGVGKTYLARNAVPLAVHRPLDRFSEAWRVKRILRKFSLMLRYLPTAFSAGLWAVRLTSLYPLMNWRRRSKVLFNWVFIDCVVRDAARCGNSVIALDQGIAQALWSTQFGSDDCPADELRTLLQRYFAGLPICEWMVVRVTASEETVRQRVEERKGSSPVDHDLKLIDKAHSAEREIVEVLDGLAPGTDDLPRIKIMSIVNNDDSTAMSRFRGLICWD